MRVQQDGRLGVPDEPGNTGWWSDGPRPGGPGATVVVGHVDSATGPGAFHGPSTLDPGDEVTMVQDDRSAITFTVRALRQYGKDAFPDSQVYATSGPPALHLITCWGTYDRGPRNRGLPVTDIDRSRTFHDAARALRPVARTGSTRTVSRRRRADRPGERGIPLPPALRLIPLRRLDRLLARGSVAGRPGE
ncbi:class F sortase [Streptomyces anulatus]